MTHWYGSGDVPGRAATALIQNETVIWFGPITQLVVGLWISALVTL